MKGSTIFWMAVGLTAVILYNVLIAMYMNGKERLVLLVFFWVVYLIANILTAATGDWRNGNIVWLIIRAFEKINKFLDKIFDPNK